MKIFMDVINISKLFEANRYYLNTEYLIKHGIHPYYVKRMVKSGEIEQVKRGLYRLPAEEIPEYNEFTFDYFDTAKAVPEGIFCLSTALHYHGLSTQRPSSFDIALLRTRRAPKIYTVSVRFYRFQEPYFSYGIEEIKTDIAVLRFYNKEKSVCDALRLRHIIGEHLGMESLNAYLKQKTKNINALLETASVCRVRHIVEPVVKATIGF